MTGVLGMLGIAVALLLLMYLAYRGVSVLLLAPVMALLATLFAEGVPLLASYTQVFMRATGEFIILYFPLFLLGALFGKLMDDSGSAESIARWIVANASALPIFNTASLVGFGAVIASLPAFAVIRDGIIGLGGFNPLVSLAVSVNVLAGITGSASGGMSIALQTLGPTYVEMAREAGISLELMHRVTTVATGGLDSLPHNGAVITLLTICGLTHRESYMDLFVVAVVVPIAALVLLIVLGTLVGSF